MIADIRFHAANLFVASLLRTSTSIWWGGRVVKVACQLASGRNASGRTISTVNSLGTWPFADGNHHLKIQVGSLFLQEPSLAAIIHLLGPSQQPDRIGLQEPIVVVVVGPQLEQESAPVICLHIRQHVERGDPRPEKLEGRPVLVFLEFLLDRLGIGQNLQSLFFRLREAGPGPERWSRATPTPSRKRSQGSAYGDQSPSWGITFNSGCGPRRADLRTFPIRRPSEFVRQVPRV